MICFSLVFYVSVDILRLSQVFGNIVEYSPPPPGLQVERLEVHQHWAGRIVVVQRAGTTVRAGGGHRAGAAGRREGDVGTCTTIWRTGDVVGV